MTESEALETVLQLKDSQPSEIFEVEVKQLTDADGTSVSDDFKLIGRGARTKFEFDEQKKPSVRKNKVEYLYLIFRK